VVQGGQRAASARFELKVSTGRCTFPHVEPWLCWRCKTPNCDETRRHFDHRFRLRRYRLSWLGTGLRGLLGAKSASAHAPNAHNHRTSPLSQNPDLRGRVEQATEGCRHPDTRQPQGLHVSPHFLARLPSQQVYVHRDLWRIPAHRRPNRANRAPLRRYSIRRSAARVHPAVQRRPVLGSVLKGRTSAWCWSKQAH
jgi:hypothetical protein